MALHAYVVTHFLTHGGLMYGGTVTCIGGGGGMGGIPSLSLTLFFCVLFNDDVLLTACLQGI